MRAHLARCGFQVGDAARPALGKYCDQIAWFTSGGASLMDLEVADAGSVDFVPRFYRDIGLTRQQLRHRASDHYLLWVAFR